MPDQLRRHRSLAPEHRARRELMSFVARMARLSVAIVLLLSLGTVGFAVTEHTSVGFSFLWALDTVATVGSIPEPRNTGAQVVKVLLIVFGVGTLFYALIAVTEFFVAGQLSGLLEARRMQRRIDELADHYVICSFGRVGRQVARDLRAAGARFVVIDSNPDNRDVAEAIDVPYILGEPSDDETLRRAGIARAKGILACVDSDAENIFIALTARELRSDLRIVARASREEAEKKLLRAGADRVISPYKSSGTEMARLALHPQVSGAVDMASAEYRMEEIEVIQGCQGAGRTIGEVRGSALIAALRRPDGAVQVSPPSEVVLGTGDVLVALGTSRTMDRLEGLFQPAATRSS
jgi:voltage-gated potassium channel